jgi:hypothetical protein
MIGRLAIFALVLLVQPSLGLAGVARGSTPISPTMLKAAIEERTAFGLRADPHYVETLIKSDSDVGSATTGMVLTRVESDSIDLDTRMTFASAVSESVLPFARSRSDFAGAYIDQVAGGQLVVLFTGADDRRDAKLRALEPSPSLGMTIREVTHTYSALRHAVESMPEAWASVYGELGFHGAGIDIPSNVVRVEVNADVVPLVTRDLPSLEAIVGVPVVAVEGQASEPAAQVCSTRATCYNPMEAGALIRQSTKTCTMGFHVTIGGDEQFLSAGHCGYGSSTLWSMTNYGVIGSEQGNLFAPYGDDVMKVQMGDSQASEWIYGSTALVGGYRAPIYGEAICASLGVSNFIDCGTVSDDFKGYNISGDWGTYYVYGGDGSGLAVGGGDSGSPVYVRSGSQAIGIGVISTTGQEYGLLSETLPIWGATLV